MESQETAKPLRCVVVTPERAVLDEPADFIVLPMFDGELGVLPGRLPLIGRLGYGELRMVKGLLTQRYFIDGGFAQVRGNVVTVLTAQAIQAADIKVDAAEEALKTALTLTGPPEGQDAQRKRKPGPGLKFGSPDTEIRCCSRLQCSPHASREGLPQANSTLK